MAEPPLPASRADSGLGYTISTLQPGAAWLAQWCCKRDGAAAAEQIPDSATLNVCCSVVLAGQCRIKDLSSPGQAALILLRSKSLTRQLAGAGLLGKGAVGNWEEQQQQQQHPGPGQCTLPASRAGPLFAKQLRSGPHLL